ncbi:MAG: GntR family transcriptional regulator [Bacilli bacterium]|nr:GntR family transcriptional regulator [Bacilli bacterium]
MQWNFDHDRPIYKQLVEQLQIAIITGQYSALEKLPSVRDLAMESKVNPNTMQKAMQELENLGLVYSKRTSGRYITEDQALIAKIKREMASEKIRQFMTDMKQLNLSRDEVIQYLKKEEERHDKISGV